MPTVHRIEVRTAPGRRDPIGESVAREARAMGIAVSRAEAAQVYLIQTREALTDAQLTQVRGELLANPVTEISTVGAAPRSARATAMIEVHPLPGVMDPVAESVRLAVQELLRLPEAPEVSTGWRYDLEGPKPSEAGPLAERLLANPVIQRIHAEPYHPAAFPTAEAHGGEVRGVRLIGLDDPALERLSREAHLFLSLDEMQTLRSHYTSIGRDPREIEMETLAQTWSEHCVHKTLKSRVLYRGESGNDPIRWQGRPGHDVQADGSVVIDNLLKSTVAAATHRLIADGVDWTLSVFVDNAGVIAFDEKHAVNIKVETHNHPSAIEPYGGAATGVGGCIRDVIATGLGARPIANTDVFCVAPPDTTDVPTGCLHPRRILTQVVAGVRDYGNRMGIPTVAGAVAFDERYIGNPLVYCGCIGVMPRDRVHGRVQPGDLIVALGGRTGRDGIHGATFSSAELEHSAADEFSHAVQIGNAITEKQTLDAIMRARDEQAKPLYTALTDCGAGGFSSAIGELGKDTGATVHLEHAPLKYAGLSPTEIWISEAQERFILSVPERNLAALRAICNEESVELAVLGTFAPPEGSTIDNPDLRLLFHGREVGRLSMHLLHEGIPTPRRDATWTASGAPDSRGASPSGAPAMLHALASLLSHPDIASKHWIIRQYDHEVKGGTAIKPLGGPLPHARAPMDAAVITPVPGSRRGLAVSCGLQTGIGDPAIGGDPYLMALAAIDECVRNLVCIGADPERIAILDNFCWPSCRKPENLGSLVRAAEGCYDGAMAYRTPFVSGKDSLNNQFTTQDGRTIEIPPTLLITGIGIVHDISRCVTMDAKRPGSVLVLVGQPSTEFGGSRYQQLFGVPDKASSSVPRTDLLSGPGTAAAVARLISGGAVLAAHDVSDGGTLTSVAEMLIGGSTVESPIGADLHPMTAADAFAESPSCYILEVAEAAMPSLQSSLAGTPYRVIGRLNATGGLRIGGETIGVESLAAAWLRPLDW
ncbi:MAG: phosphoribosylformylglycinamidine synthase [Phycisphaerales bacterium]|nr:phosphoribosylformylglycinamidine synthase [Phycisphaerales bacterium]